jgi:transcriptional regulator with XRE-family HTH domain
MARLGAQSVGKFGIRPREATPLDAQVGNRVRMRRLLLGLSQTALGDALGVTFQQVQKYEKGVNRIGASRLQHIADVLQVPVSFFFQEPVGAEAGARTAKEDGELADITRALATSAGIELMKAFVKIPDQTVRLQLARLARAIADDRTKS